MPFVGVSLGAEPALRRMRTPFVPAQCTVTLVELAVAARYVTSLTVPHAVTFGPAKAIHMYELLLLVELLTAASVLRVNPVEPSAVIAVELAAAVVENNVCVKLPTFILTAAGLAAVLAQRLISTHAGVLLFSPGVTVFAALVPVYQFESVFPVTTCQAT